MSEKATQEKHACVSVVWRGFGIRDASCGRSAKYEHNGKWYCKTHHPPTQKAKDDERSAKLKRKWDKDRDELDRQRRVRELSAAVVEAAEAYMDAPSGYATADAFMTLKERVAELRTARNAKAEVVK